MKKTLLFVLIVFMFSCKNSTEPEDLSYTTIQYREREIVGGEPMYYIMYYGDGVGAITNSEPQGDWWIGTRVQQGKDFTYQEKKFHCKTVDSDYIEVAPY
jgi:hypothetical protein